MICSTEVPLGNQAVERLPLDQFHGEEVNAFRIPPPNRA